MNQRQLASVLFAAIGVFIAVSRIPQIAIHIALLDPVRSGLDEAAAPLGQRPFAVVSLVSALLAVGLGIALIRLRDRLAERLFPAGGGPLTSGEFQAVAFSVLGLYFVVEGLAGIWFPSRWAGAVQIALGVGLFLGARNLVRIWSVGRSAGSPGGPTEGAV